MGEEGWGDCAMTMAMKIGAPSNNDATCRDVCGLVGKILNKDNSAQKCSCRYVPWLWRYERSEDPQKSEPIHLSTYPPPKTIPNPSETPWQAEGRNISPPVH